MRGRPLQVLGAQEGEGARRALETLPTCTLGRRRMGPEEGMGEGSSLLLLLQLRSDPGQGPWGLQEHLSTVPVGPRLGRRNPGWRERHCPPWTPTEHSLARALWPGPCGQAVPLLLWASAHWSHTSLLHPDGVLSPWSPQGPFSCQVPGNISVNRIKRPQGDSGKPPLQQLLQTAHQIQAALGC